MRAFGDLGVPPLLFTRGEGAYLLAPGKGRLVDFCLAFGAQLLGHAHPQLVAAVKEQAEQGFHFGACHPLELKLAQSLSRFFPEFEKMRFLNSGTEALMTAVRLARGCTKREKLLVFEGGYHGHADSFLVSAGSGLLTQGIPKSEGVTQGVAGNTFVAEYNNLEQVEKLFRKQGDQIAAVVVEPVAGNMGLVLPEEGFLEGLRRLTQAQGSLLIFDEVITGFRAGACGAQHILGVQPDLTCLGKAIGGGLPFAVLGGPRALLDKLAPKGGVYQAGTMAGNPLCLSVAVAALQVIQKERRVYSFWTRQLRRLQEAVEKRGFAFASFGLAFSIFLRSTRPRNLKEVKECDGQLFKEFFKKALKASLYLPPSPFETAFLSFAHTKEHLAALQEVMEAL